MKILGGQLLGLKRRIIHAVAFLVGFLVCFVLGFFFCFLLKKIKIPRKNFKKTHAVSPPPPPCREAALRWRLESEAVSVEGAICSVWMAGAAGAGREGEQCLLG